MNPIETGLIYRINWVKRYLIESSSPRKYEHQAFGQIIFQIDGYWNAIHKEKHEIMIKSVWR